MDEVRTKLADESGETRGRSSERRKVSATDPQIHDLCASGLEVTRDVQLCLTGIEISRQASYCMIDLRKGNNRCRELPALTAELKVSDDVEDAQPAQRQEPFTISAR
jgi:hypothetical protein